MKGGSLGLRWRIFNNSTTNNLSFKFIILVIVLFTLSTGCVVSPAENNPLSPNSSSTQGWESDVKQINWVAYSPPSADPDNSIEAIPENITRDLAVLREAGFTGIVTYSSSGVLGNELPEIAREQGFKGLIMGIWDPSNDSEINAANNASNMSIVLGYCVGNEGLGDRYNFSTLSASIQNLKNSTSKHVTTSEQIDDYDNDSLIELGDWVFPNTHPYFHGYYEPGPAVKWTEGAYNNLRGRTDRFILFKEVGLPTEGDTVHNLSEKNQDDYYSRLRETNVDFVYFEAFDQPWKNYLAIEPHWGIFRSDRTPKILALRLLEENRSDAAKNNMATGYTVSPMGNAGLAHMGNVFYVYRDINSNENHFTPSGFMGDIGDIYIDDAWETNPFSGNTCIRISYDAKGKGPYTCAYSPCKWAGVYWLEPPNNWGNDSLYTGRGYDLSKYKCLKFHARADNACRIEFKVGGIIGRYGDSLSYPVSIKADLDTQWKEYTIDLSNSDLSYIIGGFVWVTNWDTNPSGATFYLDDIRFE